VANFFSKKEGKKKEREKKKRKLRKDVSVSAQSRNADDGRESGD